MWDVEFWGKQAGVMTVVVFGLVISHKDVTRP